MIQVTVFGCTNDVNVVGCDRHSESLSGESGICRMKTSLLSGLICSIRSVAQHLYELCGFELSEVSFLMSFALLYNQRVFTCAVKAYSLSTGNIIKLAKFVEDFRHGVLRFDWQICSVGFITDFDFRSVRVSRRFRDGLRILRRVDHLVHTFSFDRSNSSS